MANAGRGKTTPPRVRLRGDIGHRVQKRRAAPDVEGEERHRLGELHQLGERHQLRRRPHDVGSEWLLGADLTYRPRSLCGAISHSRTGWVRAGKQLLPQEHRDAVRPTDESLPVVAGGQEVTGAKGGLQALV